VEGFNQTVNLACSGMPIGTTCSFANSPLTPQGSAVSTALTLSLSGTPPLSSQSLVPLAALPLSGFGFLGLIFRLRGQSKSRRTIRKVFTIGVVCLSIAALWGCSSIRNGFGPGTTSVITVTATSGKLSHSGTFNLTVVTGGMTVSASLAFPFQFIHDWPVSTIDAGAAIHSNMPERLGTSGTLCALKQDECFRPSMENALRAVTSELFAACYRLYILPAL
jgi:hypothetical protein